MYKVLIWKKKEEMFELHVLDVSGPETFVMVKDALSLNFCQ